MIFYIRIHSNTSLCIDKTILSFVFNLKTQRNDDKISLDKLKNNLTEDVSFFSCSVYMDMLVVIELGTKSDQSDKSGRSIICL